MAKIACIGAGYWGKNLVHNFAELGVLHTICDTDMKKLEDYKSRYPQVNLETDMEKVLKDGEVDGVAIAAPAEHHFSLARKFLRAGKDVFVEKPLALVVREGEELVDLAEEKGKILMVGHLLVYHPAVVKLKELVKQGDLGKINYIYSSRLNLGKFRKEENILWSFAPHDISVILLLLGEMPRHISAHGGNYLNQEIADVTVTTMDFLSGARSHIFVSWLHPYKEQKLVIVGDKKMAVFDDVAPQNKLVIYEHKIDWIERMPVPRKEEAKPVAFDESEPLKAECRHFLDCIASRKPPKTDGASALQVLRILDACQKSLYSKGEIISLSGKKEADFFLHETSVLDEECRVGEGTKIWHYCHVSKGAEIGKNCSLGQNVYIGNKVSIGDNVKVQNNVSVYEGVILEDDVFCGPSAVFTNVFNPRSHVPRKDEFRKTLVKKGATIGANATIICGNTIGRYAFIGAGAAVTKDIPDYALVYGNPAKIGGWMCECGVKLASLEEASQSEPLVCEACGKRYQKENGNLCLLSEAIQGV